MIGKVCQSERKRTGRQGMVKREKWEGDLSRVKGEGERSCKERVAGQARGGGREDDHCSLHTTTGRRPEANVDKSCYYDTIGKQTIHPYLHSHFLTFSTLPFCLPISLSV